ncbi:MAG: anti-sigma factor [Hydrogenophaga sp.]|jgi:anti-sigma factor RsiW|uniref:Transmembrane transcriptional regulator (Anti-sigma factor RsiW) n=1 Tax=Acidovorax soli TaxID=592050 RepID=A0A1H4DFE0_9BURK|nr:MULTISPECIES: anti-sigma factor [Acidovorax]MDP3254185.1 anti-sigma factor [Hydrogenophaga sp.]ODS76979.1 MAG: hypothetical protein ABS39_11360 [Acidovorax sp. SCN 65-28]SEA71170.1 Transmembrane transcriptional regulator (anti-sigma factor RsiW) [Acidovorax soli]
MNAELPPSTNAPVTEAELQAFVDGQLPPARKLDIESYLATRPAEALRLEAYRAQKRGLHALFDPVLNEPLPQRLRASARPRIASQTPWYLQRLVAGLAIAVVSGAAGWGLRGGLPTSGTGDSAQLAAVTATPGAVTRASTNEFTQRAAVAHAVYSPDARRAVEIDAANEDQLVAWLSKRMGAPMKPPHLQAQGYTLEGGRLLPGGQGPVAQFMYRNEGGNKLTLYVSNDVGDIGSAGGWSPAVRAEPTNDTAAFRFAQEGAINVFYWVDGPFGYALSSDADRSVLARVSTEVYRQLGVSR